MARPLVIEVLTHGVKIHNLTRDLRSQLSSFIKGLELEDEVQVYNQRTRQVENKIVVKKKFFVRNKSGEKLYIHRHMLDDFKRALNDIGITDYVIKERKVSKGTPISVKVKPHFTPRDYQQNIIDFVTKDPRHGANVTLYTGGGKTYCALQSSQILGKRICVMIPPKYFGIWHEAFEDIYEPGYTIEEVAGSPSLKALNRRIVEGESLPDILLISSTTYRTYIENWERFSDEPNWLKETNYLIEPDRFHEAAGIGVQINDEIQDDPGLVFKIDTISNVNKQIYLSATPYTGNDKLTNMIKVMMPKELDAPLPDVDAYANVIALLYNDDVKPYDYLGYKRSYSQIKYESNMLKSKRRLKLYLQMIRKVVQVRYYQNRVAGQRMLLFFATVAFIETVAKYLQKEFPDITVNPYVAGVPYESLLESDISVTTLKSGGTGVDVRNVKEIYSGHATDSKRDSIQMLGRARRLKDFPDVAPCLTYGVCMQIPQHRRYMNSKEMYFKDRVLSHRKLRFN